MTNFDLDSRFLHFRDSQRFPIILGRFYLAPNHKTYQVIQDNDGVYWLATWEGIEDTKTCDTPENAVLEKLTDEVANSLVNPEIGKRIETIRIEKGDL